MSAKATHLTIILTGRAPVRIKMDDWRLIAVARDRPGSFVNGTPVPDYETDSYSLRVRAHADGRFIVYGVIDASHEWTGTNSWAGGELREQGESIAAAIQRVGDDGCFPESLIREAINSLPPEDI